MGKTILIVEDEQNIVDILSFNLSREGYDTLEAYDGKTGLQLALEQNPDLILLDLMLPEMNGFDVCRKLREAGSSVPILMLTAREEETDKVLGLELGADDYITKPFEMMELLARVESVLRRTGRKNGILTFQHLCIDEDQRQVRKASGQSLELTPKEFDLLVFFVRNRNIALYREEILEKVWHDDYEGTTRTVDMHVASLRRKLGLSRQIVSVYKIGYRLEDRL